ncbi:RNA 2',3'-cyclic phosphodiesterase [Sphingomonas sp. HITSZ_GF]|uniref:RNA 2',3'-cyclic phosphodiesterase n=1 Tax=Sphingomonas sp. HITSZ_GF TaxID=3037247 RepID=UPI00240E88BE|nr:RNA 2',3'-cyclic phosphodiesterase [Sphingomonas sp. HITSZ_GF]MDG2535319.1 RNA 2',3'-cyclic phosphodiesterase [Sphingomonas sp. HITSZ_GF]
MLRLFVGLRPPAAIRAQLLALMGGIPGARWQEDEQLHITLRFIGEVDERAAEDAALALSAVRWPPLEVALDGVGTFDTRGRVNAVWAGVRPREGLAGLHRKIDQALVRAGLAPERRAYLPHVTLARMNAPGEAVARFVEAHAGLASPAFPLAHFYLFESHLGHEAARYEAVERYPLEA